MAIGYGTISITDLTDKDFVWNKFVGTHTPDVSTSANVPHLYNQSANTDTSTGTKSAATHGFRITNTGTGRTYIQFGSSSTSTATLNGLTAGKTYTLSFDAKWKVLSATASTNTSTYYMRVYFYSDKTTVGSLSSEYYTFANIAPSDRGTNMEGRCEYTFTLKDTCTMMCFTIQCSSTTSSYYASGDFIELNNIMLNEGDVAQPWAPHPDDLAVTVLKTEYQSGTSNTTAPTGTWSTTIPSVDAGNYLWTRVTYSDNKVAYSVARQGQNGTDGSPGVNAAQVTLYKRGTSASAVGKPSGNVTYTFSTGKVANTNLNNWSQEIPSGSDPVWMIAATATGTATDTTDTIEPSEWTTTPIKVLENYNQAILTMYKRAASAPSKPTSSVTYTFSSGAWSVVSGWSKNIPAVDGNPCWVTTAAAISNSATATVSGWSDVVKMVEDGVSPTVNVSKSGAVTTITFTGAGGTSTATVNDGATGSRGATWYAGTGITGTSTTATIFSGSGVSSAIVGDHYLNTSTQNVYRCTVAGAASAAKWVYEQNIKGATGSPGGNGLNGYIHVKYSNDGGSTFTGNSGETPGSWLGVYTDNTAADSTSVSAYTWTKIEGEQGYSVVAYVTRDNFTESQWATYGTVGHAETWSSTSSIRNGCRIGDLFAVVGVSTDGGKAHTAFYRSTTASGNLQGECIAHTYSNAGADAQWYYGTALTHTSGTASLATSNTAGVIIGAMYLNTSTSLVYKCTAISGSTATWTYAGNLTDGVIDNIEIGGRNLLLNTPTTVAPTAYCAYQIPTTEVLKKTKYVMQLWGVNVDSNATQVGVYWGGGNIRMNMASVVPSAQLPDSNGYICFEWTPTDSDMARTTDIANKFIRIYNIVNGHTGSNLTVEKWKLEYGNIATDWSPAPEDVEANSIKEASKPNLTPMFSRTPYINGDFWKNPSDYPFDKAGWTFDYKGDGWIRVRYDNSAGSATQRFDPRAARSEAVKLGTDYTILTEYRNNNSTPASNGYVGGVYLVQTSNNQFWGDTVKSVLEGSGTSTSTNFKDHFPPGTSGTYIKRVVKTSEAANSSYLGNASGLLSWTFQANAGAVLDVECRISIYEGVYTGAYKPCVESDLSERVAAISDGNLLRGMSLPINASDVIFSNANSSIVDGMLQLAPTSSAATYADIKSPYLPYSDYRGALLELSFDAQEIDASYSGATSNDIRVRIGVKAAGYPNNTFSSSTDRYRIRNIPNQGSGWHRYSTIAKVTAEDMTYGTVDALVDTSYITVEFGLAANTKPIQIKNIKLVKKTETVEFIAGTQPATPATGSWTGVTTDPRLYTGKTIAYKLPAAGSGNASLTLTFPDGTDSGEKEVYLGTTRITTHFGAGAVIQMTYNGTDWRATAIPNTNTYDRRLHNGAIKAQYAITAGHLIVGDINGYYNLAYSASQQIAFDLAYPILYAPSAIDAASTSSGTYEAIPGVNFSTSGAITSGGANKMLYLKGEVYQGKFLPVSSGYLTCTIPSSNDGYFYIPLGLMTSATAGYFSSTNKLFSYIRNYFSSVDAVVENIVVDLISNRSGTTYFDLVNGDLRTADPSNANNYTNLKSGLLTFYGGTSGSAILNYRTGITDPSSSTTSSGLYMQSSSPIWIGGTPGGNKGKIAIGYNSDYAISCFGQLATYDGIEIFNNYATEDGHYKPYIDFHYDKSTADFTSRIIESDSGVLRFLKASNTGDIRFSDGDIQIRKRAPSIYLHANSSASYTTRIFDTGTSGGTDYSGLLQVQFGDSTPQSIFRINGELHILPKSSGQPRLTFVYDRDFTKTAYIYCTGANTLKAHTGISGDSDAALKKNVVDLDSTYIDLIDMLLPKSYEFKDGDGRKFIGFVAQDVEDAMAELGIVDKPIVIEPKDEDDYYALDYAQIIPMLVAYCQDLRREINELKGETNE